ncbi:Asp23/Gls24 family envelope stress response protein [Streptomyces sp. AP-93]|uniref:Asp23/Gls24 family envelope stress response protein n=1 Tax=Streptomyces sp. AP-93 TaxID=2929048 RepID=UPI001FAFCAB6|nr:Asp23/Gls24 family envelope stress response protein [Streptomyces sp. AP-93]MCJ0872655.1 Asp23/Gls24 family envelope stress response protein [Streptomyces sp. AP-93]
MNTTTGGQPAPEAIGEAVLGVRGVAFLRPALTDLLRSATTAKAGRRPPGASAHRAAGVRITGTPPKGPAVEIHVVVLRGHRPLDVARAIRDAVQAVYPSMAQTIPVTVTVTGIV